MGDQFEPYRQAAVRAVQSQLGYQAPDGGYIWEGYARDAYHKQGYSWALSGFPEPAHRLMTWVKNDRLQADGQLKEYAGDAYKHAWLFHGAHRLGRFDVSYPVMKFLRSCEAPCGGLPHFAGEPYCRSLSTCLTGIGAIYAGDMDFAERIAGWALSVLDQQPDETRFYFRTTLDGELVTPEVDAEGAVFIDTSKPKQEYWEVGLPLQLMCRLAMATGDERWIERARPFLDFNYRCFDDRFTFAGSGKSALGATLYYLLTGDVRARGAACTYGDHVVATQLDNGGWHDPTEPAILLIYIDHAAEFAVWLQEMASIIPGADAKWGYKAGAS
jgi:hypothetical protein